MFYNYSFDPKDPSNNHTFDIHNIDLAIVNGIRRIILTDIPIPAAIGEKLDDDEPTVEVISNTGALHNEFIIHRVGLVPICLTEEEIESYEDNSLVLELNVKNETNATINVTSKDFIAYMKGDKLTKDELLSIFPPNKVSKDHILITRLRTGESLHFTANIVKRTARENASFNPVSLSNFSYIQNPEEASKYENINDKERCYYKDKYGDPYKYKFDIEYININVGPKYLIPKSLDIIVNKLSNIRHELIDTEKSDKIKVQQFQDITSTYEFIIENEDDTIGNIIQSYLHNKYVREKKLFKKSINCSFAGYICPHPLKSIMIIRITLENITDEGEFKIFLGDICNEIIEEIINIKTNWNKFAIENNVS